jgi:hypothetical protein
MEALEAGNDIIHINPKPTCLEIRPLSPIDPSQIGTPKLMTMPFTSSNYLICLKILTRFQPGDSDDKCNYMCIVADSKLEHPEMFVIIQRGSMTYTYLHFASETHKVIETFDLSLSILDFLPPVNFPANIALFNDGKYVRFV